jgi:hypothetical protein
MKPKAEDRSRKVATFLLHIKVIIFMDDLLAHMGYTLIGTSVDPISEVGTSSILVLLMVEAKNKSEPIHMHGVLANVYEQHS